MRRGVYPGFFSPPTIAHLTLAAAARSQRNLDGVDLALSRHALGKDNDGSPSLDQRVAVLEASVAGHNWLNVVITEHQLIADIARGYDCVIMGADKWQQIHELQFYESEAVRDALLGSLPEVAVAPRSGLSLPAEAQLEVGDELADVSSTAARAGRVEWMTDAARESGLWS